MLEGAIVYNQKQQRMNGQGNNQSEGEHHQSHIDPIEYFNAWKLESTLPSLVLGKVIDIVGEYYEMRPQLAKKQKQMEILFRYNQKLVQTVEEFGQHEKKIVDKYNALCKLYMDSFQKYCSSKNWDLNFNIKPIRCLFQQINIAQWKFHIEEPLVQAPTQPYQDQLLTCISRHFLDPQNYLEQQLDQLIRSNAWSNNSGEMLQAEELRASIKALHNTTPTIHNMFDLLEKKKNIQMELNELSAGELQGQFRASDQGFIEEVTALHRRLFQTNPEQLKGYLDHEILIRKKLKKKHKKLRDSLEAYFEKIELENSELRQQVEIERRKRDQCQKERSHFKSMYEYLQIKGAATRKDRNNITEPNEDSSMKASDIRQTTFKKNDNRVTELENQVKDLRADLLNKEKQIRELASRQEHYQIESQEIRKELEKRLVGQDLRGTLPQLISKAFENRVDRSPERQMVRDRSHSEHQSDESPIPIIFTESIPMDGWKINVNNLKQTSQEEEPNKHINDDSSLIEVDLPKKMTQPVINNYTTIQIQVAKQQQKATFSSQFRPIPSHSPLDFPHENSLRENPKKNVGPSLLYDLISISEKNAVEQQSKNIIDYSKQMRDASVGHDDKLLENNSNVLRQEQIHTLERTVIDLRQKNKGLQEEIEALQDEIKHMEGRLLEREKAQPRSFISSLEGDVRNYDACQAQQVETLCQSIAKQLLKLEANQFSKAVSNMEDILNTCKISGTNFNTKDQQNMNEPPTLSKNLQEQNLSKSDTALLNFISKVAREEEPKAKLKSSYTTEKERSLRLTLNSEEVKLLIKHQKSIYFKNKQIISEINHVSEEGAESEGPLPVASSSKDQCNFDSREQINNEDEILQGVDKFNSEGLNRNRGKERLIRQLGQSLKYSNTNLKNSIDCKQSEPRSSLKVGYQKHLDSSYVARLQVMLEDIKHNCDSGNDLYWFYQKYKQAMEALERSEGLIRTYEAEKQACMNKLTREGTLNRHKLEETIYFLQQRVNQLQAQSQSQKEEYEIAMADQLGYMEELKEKALEALGINFLELARS